MNPNTDIVIAIRARREFPAEIDFEKCIDSIVAHTHNYRLIVVDDDSDSPGTEKIYEIMYRYAESILIRTHKQHWFTRAYNTGLRLVRTPWAVLLNCDVVVDTGWLPELYAVKDIVEQETKARVGLVGSVLSVEEPRRYSICNIPGYVTGHCHLVNMQAMQEASERRGHPGWYLDEVNPLMIHIRSDVEICHSLMAHGWHCVSSYKSLVGHTGAKCWGQQLWRIPHSVDMVNYKY